MNHARLSLGNSDSSDRSRFATRGLIGFFLSCFLLVGCGESEKRVATALPKNTNEKEMGKAEAKTYTRAALPVRSASPYLNTAADAQYVGSDSCRNCHSDVHNSFFQTRHSKALSTADHEASSDGSVRHEKSGYEYTTTTNNSGKLTHKEIVLLGDDKATAQEVMIDYVVGSGRFGKSYLASLDGFLVQSPLTWYSDRKAWGMSPGYDSSGQFSFRRAVSAECLYCHAGRVETYNENAYKMTIHEQYVSCERCHGPGSLHVEKHGAAAAAVVHDAQSTFDKTIVNPADLERSLQEAICQQCHLQADAQVAVRGYDLDDFRPGLPIQDFRQVYKLGQSNDDMTIVGHVEQMHRSRCFTETKTLTCTTCHHPHSGDSNAESLAGFRQTCLKCHGDDACSELPELRHSKASNHCTVCHMPSAPTEVPHVAFTHHRIGIHRNSDSNQQKSNRSTSDVVSLLDDTNLSEADRARCTGLGALKIYLTRPEATKNQTLRLAQESLQKAWDLGAGDADVAAGLATVAVEIGWGQKIEEWSSVALDLDTTASDARSSALRSLSELQFQQGKFQAASRGFEELTTIRRDARAWFFRGVTSQNMNDTADAVQSLTKSIAIDPRNSAAHVALAALFELRGDDQQAELHRKMAEDLVRSAP